MAELNITIKGYIQDDFGSRSINVIVSKTGSDGFVRTAQPTLGDVTLSTNVDGTKQLVTVEAGSTSNKTLKGAAGDIGIKVAKTGLLWLLDLPLAGTTTINYSAAEADKTVHIFGS